jgi:hypothetical protein
MPIQGSILVALNLISLADLAPFAVSKASQGSIATRRRRAGSCGGGRG